LLDSMINNIFGIKIVVSYSIISNYVKIYNKHCMNVFLIFLNCYKNKLWETLYYLLYFQPLLITTKKNNFKKSRKFKMPINSLKQAKIFKKKNSMLWLEDST
jgi:hypothetical protein